MYFQLSSICGAIDNKSDFDFDRMHHSYQNDQDIYKTFVNKKELKQSCSKCLIIIMGRIKLYNT